MFLLYHSLSLSQLLNIWEYIADMSIYPFSAHMKILRIITFTYTPKIWLSKSESLTSIQNGILCSTDLIKISQSSQQYSSWLLFFFLVQNFHISLISFNMKWFLGLSLSFIILTFLNSVAWNFLAQNFPHLGLSNVFS